MNLDPKASIEWRSLPLWLRSIAVICIINFVSFIFGAMYVRGDALSGKEDHGRFYLGWKGTQREVSHAVYTYSYVHAASVFYVTHPVLLIAAGWYFARIRK